MNEGLTGEQIKQFGDLLKMSNEIQLNAMSKSIEKEMNKRVDLTSMRQIQVNKTFNTIIFGDNSNFQDYNNELFSDDDFDNDDLEEIEEDD